MSQVTLPVVISGNKRFNQKPKVALTTRVANNSQKKIDQLARIENVSLHAQCRFYDLEMLITNADFKKQKLNLERQKEVYHKMLTDYKRRRERTAYAQVFITEKTSADTEPQQAQGKASDADNCDPESIKSVRRNTKPTLRTMSVNRALLELEKLQTKHQKAYNEAMAELQRLQARTGITGWVLQLPSRTNTPFTAETPGCPIITSLRNRLRYVERELLKVKLKYKDLSARYERAPTPVVEVDPEEEDKAMQQKHKELLKDTFKLFCDKKTVEFAEKEQKQELSAAKLPKVKDELPRRKSMMKFDFDSMKKDGSVMSSPLLSLLSQNSYNNFVEIVENPFSTGVIPPQTRSRLLLEAGKDDSMHIWLGFRTRKEMEDALKESPGKIKQIPAALLALLEDADGDDAALLDQTEFTDSESSADEDDPRFKVFDEKKVLKRAKRGQLLTR